MKDNRRTVKAEEILDQISILLNGFRMHNFRSLLDDIREYLVTYDDDSWNSEICFRMSYLDSFLMDSSKYADVKPNLAEIQTIFKHIVEKTKA